MYESLKKKKQQSYFQKLSGVDIFILLTYSGLQYNFQCTKSSKLQWLQYRINQHTLTTNTIVYKIGLKVDNLCSFCTNSEETIIHILWECLKVQEVLTSCVKENLLNFQKKANMLSYSEVVGK